MSQLGPDDPDTGDRCVGGKGKVNPLIIPGGHWTPPFGASRVGASNLGGASPRSASGVGASSFKVFGIVFTSLLSIFK